MNEQTIIVTTSHAIETSNRGVAVIASA